MLVETKPLCIYICWDAFASHQDQFPEIKN